MGEPDLVAQSSPSARAARAIRKWLGDGLIPVGEKFPSEHAIAERLGVSRTVVHGVLVKLEKEKLLESTGPRTRVVARSVSRAPSFMSNTVAVWDKESYAPGGGETGGYSRYIQLGLARAIGEAGLHTLVLNPANLTATDVQRLATERVRGVVALHYTLNEETRALLEALKGESLPVVVQPDSDEFGEFDMVLHDHERGSFELTSWLLERGRRRILRFRHTPPAGSRRPAWVAERDKGFVRAHRKARIKPVPVLEAPSIRTEASTNEELFAMAAQLTAGQLTEPLRRLKKVDAIMTLSDGVVFPVIAALRILGKKPNKDVLVTGYDNYWADVPERAWEREGPAATVDKNNTELGRALMAVLQERTDSPFRRECIRRTVEPTLVVNTTGGGRR